MTDREKLIELLDEFFYGDFDSPYVIFFTKGECEIIADHLLTHGVTFEKQGEWIWDIETHGDPVYGIDEDFGYRCSECKVWADEYGVDGDIYEEPPTHILHYCPNCGARMKGENNG